MKKWFSILLVLSLIAGIMAGCSNNSSSESKKDTEGKKIVLKFAAQNDNTPATKKVIDEFNKS